jgi:hypothetical protein
MHYRYILLFLLFLYVLQVVHAQEDITILQPEQQNCTGYNDSFDVRVLDAKLRPVPGAEVILTFDRGSTFGSQYFTTLPRNTDSNGTLHYILINQGTNSREIDCSIVINASVAGELNSTTVFASQHGSPVDVPITTLYQVRFHVKDWLGDSLPNAIVTIDNISKITGADGLALFILGVGEHSYLASYLDGSQAGQLGVSDDATLEAVLRAYNVTLEVTDDFGNPLPVTLHMFNKTFQLENGTFAYSNTFGSTIPYRTEYQGIDMEGNLVPSQNPDAKVTYDIHAPVFGSIRSQVNGSRYELVMPVSDPGSIPSGVDYHSIRVLYRVEPTEPTTPWNTAITFTSGRDTVTAEFPELPPNSIVSFRAEMSDATGNKASIEGKFSTLAGQPAPVNNTQNQTNTQPTGGQEQGIPLLYIFGGAIVALLIVYVVFRIKSQGGESSG